MKGLEFPIIGTKVKGLTKRFDLSGPEGREKYFKAKVGDEIERIGKYLKNGTFVAFMIGKKNSGKGTYSQIFAEIFGSDKVSLISIGDIVRNAGTNWDTVSSGTLKSLESVHFTDANNGYAVGDCGIILKTINGGTNWNSDSSGTGAALYSIYFTSTDTGYVVGNGGIILKTTNGGGFPVGLPDLLSKSNALNIYPNPATDKITIESSPTPTPSQLSIMNLNGQVLITRQITEPKTHVDISMLPSGIYFVRIMGERTVEVGKFVKQ